MEMHLKRNQPNQQGGGDWNAAAFMNKRTIGTVGTLGCGGWVAGENKERRRNMVMTGGFVISLNIVCFGPRCAFIESLRKASPDAIQ
jgi:hypothetical protein